MFEPEMSEKLVDYLKQDRPTVSKVTELTEEQKALMSDWADYWIKIGLCTEPADRASWEEGARECYEAINVPFPKVLWFENPMALVQSCPKLAQALDIIGDRKDAIKQLPPEERKAELQRVSDQAMAAEATYTWSDYVGGQFWASWAAFETFFRKVVKLQYPVDLERRAIAYEKTVRSAGWWWPHTGFVGVCERPKEIHLEGDASQKRLHCATGPALSWRDGFGLCFWHGVHVPNAWIENPASVKVADILNERDAEKRRSGIEIIGWLRVLTELDAKVIDQDRDPEIGTLYAVDLPDAPGSRLLKVQCGTGRTFALPVPENMKTAREANAWTYNIDPDELQPEVRT